MDTSDAETRARPISMAALIGWLSMCLLAAALGRTIDERWHKHWIHAGAIGLIAALGLSTLEKARTSRNNSIRRSALQTRFEGRLTNLNERNAALELIDDAIRQVDEFAASERRTLRDYPLQVVPVGKNSDEFELATAHSISGSLLKISSSVVSFEHDETFTERHVLLTFRLKERRQLCFVVEIRGTQDATCGFVSSGSVMAVGIPKKDVLSNAVHPATIAI